MFQVKDRAEDCGLYPCPAHHRMCLGLPFPFYFRFWVGNVSLLTCPGCAVQLLCSGGFVSRADDDFWAQGITVTVSTRVPNPSSATMSCPAGGFKAQIYVLNPGHCPCPVTASL